MAMNKQNISSKLSENIYSQIKQVLIQARATVLTTVNTAMVQAYWHVGKLIVEAQGGEERAAYGDELLKSISVRLTKEFGKGFDASNLRNMRMFYLSFPKCDALRHELSWTHYRALIRVSNPKAREYYAKEAAAGKWSTRQLERQIATQYYERLLSTHRDETAVESLIKNNLPAKPEKFDPLTLVHDPFILEFIGAKEDVIWQESELESALISHLEEFLLELGRGFAFMGRQKRITIDGQHFYPDLVFYNVLTRSYVIIDLKMRRVDYSDIGQMQLYVNYYNREVCQPDDNPTIGIILCSEKNDTVVEYTLGDRTDIGVFSAKYDLIMPTKEELSREIELTRQKFKLING
ncbi:YhcG family protein [Xylanibacter rodentium]|jgi:predicted nuclease of restriction endonuclease-like (RecB) superfamily|nr:PDDEXK nuclease domain-containing protein [Xylanibacter rodentium]